MDPETHYKICPRCQTKARLDAKVCLFCARAYKSDFTGGGPAVGNETQATATPNEPNLKTTPLNKTVPVNPPKTSKITPRNIGIIVGSIIGIYLVGIGGMTLLRRHVQTADEGEIARMTSRIHVGEHEDDVTAELGAPSLSRNMVSGDEIPGGSLDTYESKRGKLILVFDRLNHLVRWTTQVTPTEQDAAEVDATLHDPDRRSVFEIAKTIQPYQIGKVGVQRMMGEPDKKQLFNDRGPAAMAEEVWYYKGVDGTMQVTFEMGYVKSVNVY